ncbi:hypothetical protein DWU99_18270 [Dyella psychrodurans]|uniref:Uncharacterized protein n=1 Tax=Dyella psychrodurans TaxID=1927960 RepID=A0A370WYH3_9GAMM|nr:hypothetical protein DWU99_18270 [Dyella psychrodurans]
MDFLCLRQNATCDFFDGFGSGGIVDTTLRCIKLQSARMEPLSIARWLGVVIGAIAGTTNGVALAFTGAEIGLLAGAIGPMTGVVIEGIAGGCAGRVTSFKPGATLDRNILHNLHRRDCRHTLSDRS